MNKLFTTLLVTACVGAMAQTVVYDYSASIKRIQPEIKKVKVDGSAKYGERYKVVSDKLVGYVQLPLCNSCLENNAGLAGLGIDNSSNEMYGTIWLTRNDSTLKKAAKKVEVSYATKLNVTAKAAIFGAFIDATKIGDSSPMPNDNDAKSVWMSLTYDLPPYNPQVELEKLTTDYLLKGTNFAYEYGVLGYGHNGRSTVNETGFGTITATKKNSTIAICGSTPGYECRIVKQVSGTITGWPGYIGVCTNQPMWNLCKVDKNNVVYPAVICGTWTIKYNKKLTDKGTKAEQAAEIEAMLSKNGAINIIWYDPTKTNSSK